LDWNHWDAKKPRGERAGPLRIYAGVQLKSTFNEAAIGYGSRNTTQSTTEFIVTLHAPIHAPHQVAFRQEEK
jgi:hypothetical protein